MANEAFQNYVAGQGWGADGGDFEAVKEGVYIGRLHKATIKQANSSGNWMLAIQIKITEAAEGLEAYIGRLHFLNLRFSGKNGFNPWQVKAFFKSCGMELPEIESCDEAVGEMIAENGAVQFRVFEKDGFTNTEIKQYIPNYEEPTEDDAGEEEDVVTAVENGGEDVLPEPEVQHAHEVDAEEKSVTADDVSEWDAKACRAFATEHGITLGTVVLAKMRTTIQEWILAQYASIDDEPANDDAADKEALIAFCAGNGIDGADESMAVDDLRELIGQYEFDADSLTEDEVATLEKYELGDCIQKPEPKKAPAKKK